MPSKFPYIIIKNVVSCSICKEAMCSITYLRDEHIYIMRGKPLDNKINGVIR